MDSATQEQNTKLPKSVYFKHGSYYFVHKNRWHKLGKSVDIDLINKIEGSTSVVLHGIESRTELKKHLTGKIRSIRSSATARGLSYELTNDQIIAQAERQNWRCAITRLHFSLEKHPDLRFVPYAPSVDRIDWKKGYTTDNIQIVCSAANIARNNLPEDVFFQIAVFASIEMARKVGLRSSKNLFSPLHKDAVEELS